MVGITGLKRDSEKTSFMKSYKGQGTVESLSPTLGRDTASMYKRKKKRPEKLSA